AAAGAWGRGAAGAPGARSVGGGDGGAALALPPAPRHSGAHPKEVPVSPTTTAVPTIELMLEINAAFNARDVDRIVSFFADDATFLMARGPEPDGRRVRGKEAIRKVLADRFAVISGMRWDHVDHFVAGNRAVSVWMVTGKGADGEMLNYRGCDIYEFRGDKILNKDTYSKLLEHPNRL